MQAVWKSEASGEGRAEGRAEGRGERKWASEDWEEGSLKKVELVLQ